MSLSKPMMEQIHEALQRVGVADTPARLLVRDERVGVMLTGDRIAGFRLIQVVGSARA